MANAFSDGRLSLWHTSPQGLNLDYAKARGWGITDIMVPAHLASVDAMNAIRTKVSGDGKNFRAHVSLDGTHGETGRALSDLLVESIKKFQPGVAEVNIESGDDNKIGVAAREFLETFRNGTWRDNFPVCINVVPMKAYVLPFDLMIPDPNCYGRIQLFYGAEMRPADPDECAWDWTHRGFPADRLTFMYSAKSRRLSKIEGGQWVDSGQYFCDLPVFSDGGAYVRRLRRGGIFNANLMRETGLL